MYSPSPDSVVLNGYPDAVRPQVHTNLELAETTKDLQDEKARMDALLVRQYNLIQCFSNPKATGNDMGKAGTGSGGDNSTVGEMG